jgi:hypothetical protein
MSASFPITKRCFVIEETKNALPCGKTESSQLGQFSPYPYPIIDLAGLSVPKLKNLLFVCGLYGSARQKARAFFVFRTFCGNLQKRSGISPAAFERL